MELTISLPPVASAEHVLSAEEEMKLLEVLAHKHGYSLLRIEPGTFDGDDNDD